MVVCHGFDLAPLASRTIADLAVQTGIDVLVRPQEYIFVDALLVAGTKSLWLVSIGSYCSCAVDSWGADAESTAS